ncbi:protein of unknown function [uncultured Woeseiaceae bacterium]|uniref:Uncharacterized protein n=1 Tax=uncultured Woeseiaceae bacterium TaxID=1983305 RepID=A0A7D9H4L4_9GAMM|nr:protein of unknown function [uncultured Woeseiaceae bacterium]
MPRRNQTLVVKSIVALEASKNDNTVTELLQRFDGHSLLNVAVVTELLRYHFTVDDKEVPTDCSEFLQLA